MSRTTQTRHAKSDRIEARTSQAVKHLLQEAARLSHKTNSELLLDAGTKAADLVLADRQRFELSDEAWLQFQALLDRPVQSKLRLAKLLTEPGGLD